MDIIYTPTQIAKQLHVSTTTLRRYEKLNLIPDVPRTASNRRTYTSIHFQAFTAIRALLKAFDIPVAYEVMKCIKQGNIVDSLWLINQQLQKIQMEKQRVESILNMIHQTDFSKYEDNQITDEMTIGEVANICGVNPSAIRHWEKEGLIRSKRNPQNGYRIFTSRELRKIIVISSLRKTVYFIDNMKQLLDDLDTKNLKSVHTSFQRAIQQLNDQLTKQYEAIAALMKYIQMIGVSRKQ